MITGYFDEHHHPKVNIDIVSKTGRVEFSALIDTGFDGELSVPKTLIEQLNSNFLYLMHIELADGSAVTAPVYEIPITWFEKPRTVSALATASAETVIGTELLRDNTLIINFSKKQIQIV